MKDEYSAYGIKKKRNTKGATIAQAILEQYQPQTKEDIESP